MRETHFERNMDFYEKPATETGSRHAEDGMVKDAAFATFARKGDTS